jgi:hypothetical protein
MSNSSGTKSNILNAIEILKRADARYLEDLGYRLEPCDFYSPINSLRFLEQNEDLWSIPSVPLDIDWRIDHQMAVANEVSQYVLELADIPETAEYSSGTYCWGNPFWNHADALVQYGLLRSRRPQRLIEIGCGFSSLLANRAIAKNREEDASYNPHVILVEPNPRRELLNALPSDWKLVESTLQRCPLEEFDALAAGDILFYDGSHCVKTGSDVNWFFFRVLPRIRGGVLIHVHDAFFPRVYPREWLLERKQSWNEQYLLQAFLMNNSDYAVEIANAFLADAKPSELKQLYKDVQPFWGASFWMTKLRVTMRLATCPNELAR